MYDIRKNYRDNPVLRASFNALAEAVFGLSFEAWYQNGFWGDNYIPYSVVENGRVVANVSVNRTDLYFGGKVRKLIQLGTVMTEESCRNKGMIRAIMAEIDRDFSDVEGAYLFGNDSVVNFYPKFGFRRGVEYEYSRELTQDGPCRMEKMPMEGPGDWAGLERAMKESAFRGGCEMVNNPELIFFYVTHFMKDTVWYSRELNAWTIGWVENGELVLDNVFAPEGITLDAVVAAFGGGIRRVRLEFAPANPENWVCRPWHEEDCNFFVRGDCFAGFEAERLRIPALSHT